MLGMNVNYVVAVRYANPSARRGKGQKRLFKRRAPRDADCMRKKRHRLQTKKDKKKERGDYDLHTSTPSSVYRRQGKKKCERELNKEAARARVTKNTGYRPLISMIYAMLLARSQLIMRERRAFFFKHRRTTSPRCSPRQLVSKLKYSDELSVYRANVRRSCFLSEKRPLRAAISWLLATRSAGRIRVET